MAEEVNFSVSGDFWAVVFRAHSLFSHYSPTEELRYIWSSDQLEYAYGKYHAMAVKVWEQPIKGIKWL